MAKEEKGGRPLVVSVSPHVKNRDSVTKIMLSVVAALIPAVVFSIYQFGLYVLAMYAVSIATCLLTEYLIIRLRKNGTKHLEAIIMIMAIPLRRL